MIFALQQKKIKLFTVIFFSLRIMVFDQNFPVYIVSESTRCIVNVWQFLVLPIRQHMKK